MKPEQNVARLYSATHSLRPPVDVEALVSQVADLEYATFPTSCDALLIRKAPRSHILLSNNLKYRKDRLRFTLAHELAHLTLPWQAGTFFCHANALNVTATEEVGRQMEIEANRFASELLVPADWMFQRFSLAEANDMTPAQIVAGVASTAEVSISVALFATCMSGPPGILLALVNGDRVVQHAGVSPNTYCQQPARESRLDLGPYRSAGGVVTEVPLDMYSIVCVDFRGAAVEVSRPQTESLDILKEILAEVERDENARRSLGSSLNGVIGWLNTKAQHLSAPQDIVSALKQRLVGRTNLAAVVAHSRFEVFLVAKAYELSERRGKK